MFGTFRKHQSWLWFIIIGVMVLSMILWQSSTGSRGQGPATGNFGAIDNQPITMTEMRDTENEASLMYFVRTHEWPDTAGTRFDVQQAAYERLFLIRKMNELNIKVDPDSAAQLAGLILRQFNNGQAVPMDVFIDQILKPRGLTAEDFQRFLEHDLAIQQLESVVGLSGKVVTPAEVESLYVQENQELSVDAVFFTASNYLAKIQAPTPEALGGFYTNQQAKYREPDQMQLSYVYFNVTNFMPEAEKQLGTNINRAADEAMARIGTNTFKFGKTPEEARAKIRDLIIQEAAISNANTKAVSFQNEVVNKGSNVLQNLPVVAKEKGLEVMVTKPFDKDYGPGELDLGQNYPVASFFDLTADAPLVDQPIRGMDGVYVVAYNKLIPSRIPPLDEIHSRVDSDFKFSQALRLAQMNGQVFAQTATNELSHGKTFEQTCSSTRVTPTNVPPFSLSTERLPEVEDFVDLNLFKRTAFDMPIGGISRFLQTPDGGFVVHVRQRLPVDQTEMQAKLPDFSKLVRERRQNEAFNLWFNQGYGQELARGLRDIPALHKQQ